MTTEAQKAAIKRYKAAGKQITMTLHFTIAEYGRIEESAKKNLRPVATYCREAIRARMDTDGEPGEIPMPGRKAMLTEEGEK